ncbi:hypothetical protein EJB05_32235, partial [Eragrostis curvula]
MSTQAAARNKKGLTPSAAVAAAAATPARFLGRGVNPTAMPFSLSRGGGSAATAASGGGFDGSSSAMDGSPIPASPFDGSYDGSPGSWRLISNVLVSKKWFSGQGYGFCVLANGKGDKHVRPPGGFMSYFANLGQNSHLVGAAYHSSPPNQAHNASSPPEVEMRNGNDSTRTEKRIMWTVDEDVILISAWVENSTNSSCGADRAGNQYWNDVVEYYNKTTPPLRRRNLKQCKDRWHKINRWTDLFECAYVKARRVFTSGYSDQMWIDAAHKKSFHLEGDSQEDEAIPDEMPKRPIGQKAAKKAALAAKGKNKESGDVSGNSKETAIDLDKFDKYSKFQEDNHEKRLQILEVQQKLSSEKLEASKIAHQTAQENKAAKMMEAYLSMSSQDTSSMSDEEKAERVVVMNSLGSQWREKG